MHGKPKEQLYILSAPLEGQPTCQVSELPADRKLQGFPVLVLPILQFNQGTFFHH